MNEQSVSAEGNKGAGERSPGRSENRYLLAEVLNALPSPVLLVGSFNEILLVNSASELFFDLSSSQLLGQRLEEFLPSDSPVIALLEKVRNTGTSITEYALEIETPRISSHNLTVEASPLAERGGSVVLALQKESIARKLDHQLLHRNAARSVTAMAAMLAHEVKNPLTPIALSAQRLKRKYAQFVDDTIFEECTETIISQVELIRNLVNEFSSFALFPSANPVPCHLMPIIEETIALYRE
ncbi:MAG: histidine kinase dimerization/phospho-acceptor domain-containing protein, partial [Kiloniellales bacterium]|nr:histidine kinase dimerization/phospho-acceptor domain-containing protein [Kiloniellales bacterium]